jgi:hypothetical protein
MPLNELTRRTYDRPLKKSRALKESVGGLQRTLTNATGKRSVQSGYSIDSSGTQILVRRKSGGYILAGFNQHDRAFCTSEVEFMKMVTVALDQKLKHKGA